MLGVVMTGMGQDGRDGAKKIKDKGGQVIIQDENTSVVWGMPGAVSAAGLASAEYPLEQIASILVENTKGAGSAHSTQLAGAR